MEPDPDGLAELARAEDFRAMCELGHPLEECGQLADIDGTGSAHRVDIQCCMCETIFVFRREIEAASVLGWRLVESSDRLVAETCISKRMRKAMAEAQRRARFHAHWQNFGIK